MPSTITKAQFGPKWANLLGRFKDNDTFDIVEADFREFAADIDKLLSEGGEPHTNKVRGGPKLVRDLTRRDTLPVTVLAVGTSCLVLNAVTADEDDEGKVVGPRTYTLVYAGEGEAGSFAIPADAVLDLSEARVKWVEAGSKEAQQPSLKFFNPTKFDGYALGELAKWIFNGSTEFVQARKVLVKPANGTIPAPTTGDQNDANWEKVSADYVSALTGRITLDVARTYAEEEAGTAHKVFFVRRPDGKPEVRLEMDDDSRFDLQRAKQFNPQTGLWELGSYDLVNDEFDVATSGQDAAVFVGDPEDGNIIINNLESSGNQIQGGILGTIVNGILNRIAGGLRNAIYGGNQNTIPASCQDVLLINCQAFTVPENTTGKTYINNLEAGTGGNSTQAEFIVAFSLSGPQEVQVHVNRSEKVGTVTAASLLNVSGVTITKNGVAVNFPFTTALNDQLLLSGTAASGGGLVTLEVNG
ncbi:hypothetical protein [Hymenobacter chitinivorans]|uniref:Uncharacterized protein n=1 Tax=Hymenobacter chitinivorans DSM 11115 TaxID=1121954 RepID=A0A2M9BNB2_9BACT|nr:hypothetical protein [Hymenobacter chitinivorans]PJJ59425.1 hypothetical protein CLV45_0842 [Hymenobacter chitinivorans DSM 11115]